MSMPPPQLGTDEVVFAPDDDHGNHGSWVAMEDRSVGTRFKTEAEALAAWHRFHTEEEA